MGKDYYDRKQERILSLYTKLLNGDIVNKKNEAEHFHVSPRSLQRDLDDLRGFLANHATKNGIIQSIVYEKKNKGYRLLNHDNLRMTKSEVLAVCKILLESRAFTKEELFPILSKLLENCSPSNYRKNITALIANEQYHYIEPHHCTKFIDVLWDLGMAIQEHQYVQMDYRKLKNKDTVSRLIKPVGIMFSEFYFYLVAFIEDIDLEYKINNKEDLFPTIYRVDRIQDFLVKKEKFLIPYRDRFEEGEFRKRIQFMYGGNLQRIQFKYSGLSIEAVLDRLPTAEIIAETDGIFTISAEVFGKGIDMWLRSQGDAVQLL